MTCPIHRVLEPDLSHCLGLCPLPLPLPIPTVIPKGPSSVLSVGQTDEEFIVDTLQEGKWRTSQKVEGGHCGRNGGRGAFPDVLDGFLGTEHPATVKEHELQGVNLGIFEAFSKIFHLSQAWLGILQTEILEI